MLVASSWRLQVSLQAWLPFVLPLFFSVSLFFWLALFFFLDFTVRFYKYPFSFHLLYFLTNNWINYASGHHAWWPIKGFTTILGCLFHQCNVATTSQFPQPNEAENMPGLLWVSQKNSQTIEFRNLIDRSAFGLIIICHQQAHMTIEKRILWPRPYLSSIVFMPVIIIFGWVVSARSNHLSSISRLLDEKNDNLTYPALTDQAISWILSWTLLGHPVGVLNHSCFSYLLTVALGFSTAGALVVVTV